MKIRCQEHYDKVVEYAKSIGDTTFQNCIELYRDFAPHSFGFAEVAANGSSGIVGGLLYHGKPDQSYAVTLTPIHGWSIHT